VINANTEHACVDCRRYAVATVVQSRVLWPGTRSQRLCHWHICGACLVKREAGQ